MGQLIDGKWITENIISNHDKTGLYYKRDSVFRNRIEREPARSFPPSPAAIISIAPSPVRGRIARR